MNLKETISASQAYAVFPPLLGVQQHLRPLPTPSLLVLAPLYLLNSMEF